ncbi:MAG TPA: endonuclease/exonuclease/phosphatase family protein [Opitutaceae bacterium]|nr:endonuclease/exonuclease/phosphatase family protein [Opitutaceae bacterium]
MFARIESYWHGLRRRLSRNEWAIRHLGLKPSEGTSEEPGLLLLQIDGFGRAQFERALAAGRMPFLQRLLRREGYELHTFYPGLPSTTPAVQAELYYGVRSAVPAFSFFDRTRKKLGRMWDPEWAKAREEACAKEAEGLLQGGSSWSNIYTGGAGQWESHFCAASIGLGDMWRTKKIRNIFVFIVLNLTAAFRIAWLLLVEFCVGFADMVRAITRGRRPDREFLLLVSRVFVGVGLRELLTISGQIDVTRGLPIVHMNFVGYDEESHVRGPASGLAHYGLRAIDRSIKQIVRAAQRSNRRDYAVWIFSDHGQEATRSILDLNPGGIEAILSQCLELSQKHDWAWRTSADAWKSAAWLSRSRFSEARRERGRVAVQQSVDEEKNFTVAAMGPVAHVYFPEPKTDDQRRALAERLVTQGGIPGVLVRAGDGAVTWFHERGATRVPDEVPPLLLPHPAPLREEIARDLVQFCENPNSGDLTLLGWSPWVEAPLTFAAERGAHGGFGPHETQGFVLLPTNTPLPDGTEHFIRPSALRIAALTHIGRCTGPACRLVDAKRQDVRLMTYNVHGCSGMDGRVSPRRVARVIRGQMPDIVALQEVDLGRRRSRAEDQGAIIARELGMNVVFCPTITRDDEHYGHALLSRWPIDVVKRMRLPHDPASWFQEPRAAMWARVTIGGQVLNIITTHLGLGPHERVLQVRALLSEEWLGGIPDHEPVMLCGDFNALPGSAPYKLTATRLRDVQAAAKDYRPLGTFSSMRPLVRLDHIFVSPHFTRQKIVVVRNDLTRVASDHLPLVADLRVAIAPAGTSTTTPQKSGAHTPQAQPAGAR